MSHALQQYLQDVKNCLIYKAGPDLAQLLSYQDTQHSQSRQLLETLNEHQLFNQVNSKVGIPWDDLVHSHLRVCKMLYHQKFVQAGKEQQNSMTCLTKILSGIKDDNWPIPVLKATARDLRLLAIAGDQDAAIQGTGEPGKPDEQLEKAADLLMAVFRVCATDIRTAPENSKRLAMMAIINQLFKIYFKINKLHLCKPLIRALDNSTMMSYFCKSEKVNCDHDLEALMIC